ncbi:MAG: hypothetical protein ACRD0G_20510 [Acidimicrobiales bacterium]
MQPWTVVAHNTATASANRIHADEVARQFGFRGGLVPGVDVYAYLTHPAVAAWGLAWLERGTMHARFQASRGAVPASVAAPASSSATSSTPSRSATRRPPRSPALVCGEMATSRSASSRVA